MNKKINYHIHFVFHQISNFIDKLSNLLFFEKKNKDNHLYINSSQNILWFHQKKTFKMLSFYKNVTHFKRDFLLIKYEKLRL